MKLSVEKLQSGKVRVEVVTDVARKPLSLDLTREQIDLLCQLLRTARDADRFQFQVEA